MPRRFILKWLQSVEHYVRRLGIAPELKDKELTIVFLDSDQAKRLNHQFRKKNYPTDVLSFSSEGESALGELVLCASVIKKQSCEHQLSFNQELGYLLLHGVLHLLGFEHEKDDKAAKKMFAIQDQAFDHLCRKFWK
jgi:probable rRNA maturation factor